MHHMDWDNLRFFLAVARKGSIRAASVVLSVNHSTVARRITAFEKKLGVRLFERFPTGYVLTATGEEILKSAQHVEDEIVKLDRQVIGRDAQLTGVLRVTMPSILATHLIMPDISAFTKSYPNIQLELVFSNEVLNLRKREADIAIRLTQNPPDYLVGRKVMEPAKGVYASHEYLKKIDPDKYPDKLGWIAWEDTVMQTQRINESRFSSSPIAHYADDLLAQLEAVKAGMGIAMFPCFIVDTVPELVRLEKISAKGTCGDLWILTHEDLRATARVRVFCDFMLEAFEQHRELMEGRRYIQKPSLVSSVAF